MAQWASWTTDSSKVTIWPSWAAAWQCGATHMHKVVNRFGHFENTAHNVHSSCQWGEK
jgi:hypothetical protein